MFRKLIVLFCLIFFCLEFIFAQTNPKHIRVSGYYKKNGTYVQPYFRTTPNPTNLDNFSTKGNVNPYTGKPGWVEPDGKYNTLYYNTSSYSPQKNLSEYPINSKLPIQNKNRTYIEDESGNYTYYLTVKDERTFKIFDMNDNFVLYIVINHRGDWRIFDSNMIYIKTIFVTTEK